MRDRFADYVRSGAFHISLSERQIKILLHLAGKGPEDERLNLAPYQALERRGLAEFKKGNGFSLTLAGATVAELLILAGYEKDD